MIVTASPELYVGPLAQRLGIDHVLGSCIEVDGSGVLTGNLNGSNCRWPEKVARLRAWLGEGPFELWAYGDSDGDRDLLAFAAANGVRVGREVRPGGLRHRRP